MIKIVFTKHKFAYRVTLFFSDICDLRYELSGLMTLGATLITKRGGTFSPKVAVKRVFPWNK